MKNLLLALLLAFTASSCGEYTYVQSDPIYDDVEYAYASSNNVTVVVTYGTPYYYNGRLWYYLYNGLYYYPFWYNGYWYLRPYGTLYSWDWYYYNYRHFRPHHGDRPYRFRPGHHGFSRPGNGHSGRPHGGGPRPGGHKPNGNPGVGPGNGHHNNGYGTRPSINNGRTRPSGTVRTQPRPSSTPRSGSIGSHRGGGTGRRH